MDMKFIGSYGTDTAVFVDSDMSFRLFRFTEDREMLVEEWVHEVLTRDEVIDECDSHLGIMDYDPEALKEYYLRLSPARFVDACMLDFFVRVDGYVFYAIAQESRHFVGDFEFFDGSISDFIREFYIG